MPWSLPLPFNCFFFIVGPSCAICPLSHIYIPNLRPYLTLTFGHIFPKFKLDICQKTDLFCPTGQVCCSMLVGDAKSDPWARGCPTAVCPSTLADPTGQVGYMSTVNITRASDGPGVGSVLSWLWRRQDEDVDCMALWGNFLSTQWWPGWGPRICRTMAGRTRVCQVRRMKLATAAATKCWIMLPACQYELITSRKMQTAVRLLLHHGLAKRAEQQIRASCNRTAETNCPFLGPPNNSLRGTCQVDCICVLSLTCIEKHIWLF